MCIRDSSCVDEPFQSRVNRVVIDTMATKQKVIGIDPVPHIRISNFLAPRGIDLNHHHYVVMDGLYYTFLYIKGNGYPSMVRAGWMSSLINAGEGVDVDVFLRRENRSKSSACASWQKRCTLTIGCGSKAFRKTPYRGSKAHGCWF